MEETQIEPAARPSNAILITGIVLAIAFPFLSLLLKNFGLSGVNTLIASRFVFWAEIGVLWLYATRVEKQSLFIWSEKRSGLKFIIGAILLLYALSFTAQVVSTLPRLFGWHENGLYLRRLIAFVKGKPYTILFLCITAGFTEEIIFRGYILTRLSVLINNKYVPVIITSVLFSAVHFSFNSLGEFMFTFLIGIIMSLHYQKYGNIKPLIVTHILIDLIGFFVAAHFVK